MAARSPNGDIVRNTTGSRSVEKVVPANTGRVCVYDIPAVPDCTHHRLVSLCSGNVREHIYRAGEQLLRMVANFEQGQLGLALRFLFDPRTGVSPQHRLRLQLAVKAADGVSEDTVRQLIDAGPLAEFYEFDPAADPRDTYEIGRDFTAVCEIVRQEQAAEPSVPREVNPKIPALYYCLVPFEAREDNDYLMVDALLAKMSEPCAVEMLVTPVDHTKDMETHFRYVTRLMAVNEYGDDLYIPGRSDTMLDQRPADGQEVLTLSRKKDPLADEILRDHRDLHKTLRQPQLLFHLKAFSKRSEQSLMLASATAEAGLKSGKYRIISYHAEGGATAGEWLARSLNDSRAMEVSLNALYPQVWNRDLPKGWLGMSRLSRMATVDELKGLIRLPVGGYGSPRCIRKATDPKPGRLEGKVRLFLSKGATPRLTESIRFTTGDGRVNLSPKTGAAPERVDPQDAAGGEEVYDIEVEARTSNVQEYVRPREVCVVKGTVKGLLRVYNPRHIGGAILIGSDLESSAPAPRSLDRSDLRREFRSQPSDRLDARLALDALTKHVFVSGVPGSGKTTGVFNLLVQLYQHGVPFLVIEPAKTEYRALKTLRDHPDASVREMASELRVYTPGNDALSPLRFNPLAHPAGIGAEEHIDQVLSCFEAAMPVEGPLQALIAEAVEQAYAGRAEGDFPRMTDLLDAARRIMTGKAYEGEVKANLQAAIEVRLGLLTRRAMGRIFQCRDGIPSISEILEHPTLIEMDYLSQDHACLLTLFLLAAVREHIRIDPKRPASGLHHVMVIEEAHNIVGRTGQAKASPDVADPKAFAAQYVSRMLAELRGLGEGIVIADQLPSAVAPEVVKNTGTKLAFRLVSNDDREDLGGAMLLGETETEEIARLPPGEAYFYTEGLYRPRRLRCLNANEYLGITQSPIGSSLRAWIAGDEWCVDGKKRRGSAVRRDLSMALDEARIRLRAFQARFAEIQQAFEQARQLPHTKVEVERRESWTSLSEDCRRFRYDLDVALASLDVPFQAAAIHYPLDGEPISAAIRSVIDRWAQTARPGFLDLLGRVSRLARRLQADQVPRPKQRKDA